MCALPVYMCVSRDQKRASSPMEMKTAVCWALSLHPLQQQQRALKYTVTRLIFLLVSQEARQFMSLTLFI